MRALQPQLPCPGRAGPAAEPGPDTQHQLQRGGHRRPVRPQPTRDGTNPAQLTALPAATTLVTLGIDIDWAAVLTRCAELDLGSRPDPRRRLLGCRAPARRTTPPAAPTRSSTRPQTTAGHRAGALAQIKRRAPHAPIYLAGYPALLPAADATCAHLRPHRRRPGLPQRRGTAAQHHAAAARPGRGRRLRRHLHPVPRPRRVLRPGPPLNRTAAALASVAGGMSLISRGRGRVLRLLC